MAITLGTPTNSGNGANTDTRTFAHTLDANAKCLVVVVTGYDSSATDSVVSSVTWNTTNSLSEIAGGRYRVGSEFQSIWYLSNPPTGGAYNIVVTMAGACTDVQATAIGLIDASAASIIYDSYDTGTGTGSASAVVSPAATGSYAVGGGVALGGTASSLSVSAGTEISGSEVDMGAQMASCATAAESGGSATITWAYTGVTCTALAATFKSVINRLASTSSVSTVTDSPTLTLIEQRSIVVTENGAFANGYSAYRTITIDNTKVSGAGDLTDFPMLFSGTYDGTGGEPDLRVTGSGGKVTSSSGYDIIFTSDEAGTTQLDHEIRKYDSTTGQFIAWVRIPTLDGDADTTIYMWYGNSSITTSQEDIDGTWETNFKAVWHLSESSGTRTDSADNNNDLGDYNTVTGGGGKIHLASSFERDNSEHLRIADASQTGLDFTTGTKTFSGWFNFQTQPNGGDYTNNRMFITKDEYGTGGEANRSYTWYLHNTRKLYLEWENSSSQWTSIQTTNAAFGTGDTGTWYHIAVSFDIVNKTGTFYVNGSAISTTVPTANANSIRDGAAPVALGCQFSNSTPTPVQCFDGLMEEVRVYNGTLSSDWIATEYANQNDPSTFYAIGNETINANPTESITIELITGVSDVNASVSSASTISDSITSKAGDAVLSAFSTSTLSDAITSKSGNAIASTSSTSTLNDSVATTSNLNPSVSSASTLADPITSKAGDAIASASSTSTLSDSVTADRLDVLREVTALSTSTISDTITSKAGDATTSVSSVSTLADAITTISNLNASIISVSTLADTILSIGGAGQASVASASTLADTITSRGGGGVASVSSPSTVADEVTITTSGDNYIVASSTSTLQDNVSSIGGDGVVSVVSTSTLSDAITAKAGDGLIVVVSASTLADTVTTETTSAPGEPLNISITGSGTGVRII